MAACSFIKPTGVACKAIPMRGEGWCYVHHPQYQERRRREGAKGGKRGGRGRPVVELRAIEDKLERLAEDVLDGSVEPGVAAVVVQIRNTQIRAISTGLKAKEIDEIEVRISELETSLRGQEKRRWG